MNSNEYQIGDFVVLTSQELKSDAGIVSYPITKGNAGFVPIYKEGGIIGCQATIDEIESTDEKCQDFTQLTYHLLKLSSRLIEKHLLPLAKTSVQDRN